MKSAKPYTNTSSQQFLFNIFGPPPPPPPKFQFILYTRNGEWKRNVSITSTNKIVCTKKYIYTQLQRTCKKMLTDHNFSHGHILFLERCNMYSKVHSTEIKKQSETKLLQSTCISSVTCTHNGERLVFHPLSKWSEEKRAHKMVISLWNKK